MAVKQITSWADSTEQTVSSGQCRVTAVEVMRNISQANEVYLTFWDASNPTVAGTDLNDGGNLSSSFVVRADSATVTKYGGALFPQGIYHDTYITVAATQRDEGAIAGTNQAYVLYREA